MSFENLVLADVKLESNALPVGTYTFELLPTAAVAPNKFNGKNELSLSAAVAEGDLKGRRAFWTYPDPSSVGQNGKLNSWAAQAMKKLVIVLGVEEVPGEAAVDTFNRAASSGQNRFSAEVLKNVYIKDGVEKEGNPKFGIFTVAPAA